MKRTLTRDEISLETLNEVLSMVYETTVDKENSDIFLDKERIHVALDKKCNLIQFVAVTGISHTTSDAAAAKVANQLNSKYFIVKTFFLREGIKHMLFFFQYEIMYDSGLDIGLLLKALRRYNDIASKCIDDIEAAGLQSA